MESVKFDPRPNWQQTVEARGFAFHSIGGEEYWNEKKAIKFTLAQIEDTLEDPTEELMSMCYDAVAFVCDNPEYLTRLGIPQMYHASVIKSWNDGKLDLYGRFDFAYVNGVAKMLEFNADTPTSLIESAIVQWDWLEEMKALGRIPEDADQFNSIHEKLLAAFKEIYKTSKTKTFHFAGILDSEEDRANLQYLEDMAFQAGFTTKLIDIRQVGVDADHNFCDDNDYIIEHLFKLYPIEDMMREDFGKYLCTTPTTIFEPLWKSILSNKGILPILWMLNPNHPNLLPAYFSDTMSDDEWEGMNYNYVIKPFFSREGADIEMFQDGVAIESTLDVNLPLPQQTIHQALTELYNDGEDWLIIGSWVIAGRPAGISVRADSTRITRNTSRFIPHYIHG